MLPILDAATGGRVTPYRLWRLALSRGRFRGNFHGAIKGVDYGPILEHYSGSDPQLFGKLGYGYVPALEETGTPEDIAELLRAAGYWMWMRPDRLEARNALAKTYMHTCARWCLPHGEAELKWWNDRSGDEVFGWDYMKRCHVESHSMRNRRRIWRAAESIEDECEKLEKEVDYSGLVDLLFD
ncbi:hypothetical protein FRC09_018070 [Ceratobasidium sp. 395]|nr:hypothetical protein FRC09_018070 [Ceratobasidium sp. 395]